MHSLTLFQVMHEKKLLMNSIACMTILRSEYAFKFDEGRQSVKKFTQTFVSIFKYFYLFFQRKEVDALSMN